MVGNCADRRGPRNEAVFVVMPTAVIEVRQETELASVTFPNQILPEHIGQVDLLPTPAELIQVGVGVLLEHVEARDVVLPQVVVVIPENPNAKIGIVEDKPAEIAHERLDTGAQRNEIVIVRYVADV